MRLPEDIVDPDDVPLIGILGIDCDGGTGLDPNVTTVLLHPSIILGHTLALVQH